MSRRNYLSFLKHKLSIRTSAFDILFEHLLERDFTWMKVCNTDADRALDGLSLRHLYFREWDERGLDWDAPCSVLEMIAALSIRIEQDILGEPGNDHPEKWFWEFLDNLGIVQDNEHFDETAVDEVLDIWLMREYAWDGHGGMFPLKHANYDQRGIPIWDQMAEYLSENYS